jgi:hypothetical protein
LIKHEFDKCLIQNTIESVHDMTGNSVLEVLHAESVQGVRESVLDVSSLRSGMYVLVITSDRGEQVVQRMVVER